MDNDVALLDDLNVKSNWKSYWCKSNFIGYKTWEFKYFFKLFDEILDYCPFRPTSFVHGMSNEPLSECEEVTISRKKFSDFVVPIVNYFFREVRLLNAVPTSTATRIRAVSRINRGRTVERAAEQSQPFLRLHLLKTSSNRQINQ